MNQVGSLLGFCRTTPAIADQLFEFCRQLLDDLGIRRGDILAFGRIIAQPVERVLANGRSAFLFANDGLGLAPFLEPYQLPIASAQAKIAAAAVILLQQMVAAFCFGLAQQRVEHIDAI